MLYFGSTDLADIYPVELEPRKPRDDEVDMFIDLAATNVDHEEVRDLTFHRPFHTFVNSITIFLDREREGCDNAGRETAWSITAHS